MAWIAHKFRHMSYKVILLLFLRLQSTVYCYICAFTFTISPIYCLLLNHVLPFTVNFLLILPLLMSFYVDLLITVNHLTPLLQSSTNDVLSFYSILSGSDTLVGLWIPYYLLVSGIPFTYIMDHVLALHFTSLEEALSGSPQTSWVKCFALVIAYFIVPPAAVYPAFFCLQFTCWFQLCNMRIR